MPHSQHTHTRINPFPEHGLLATMHERIHHSQTGETHQLTQGGDKIALSSTQPSYGTLTTPPPGYSLPPCPTKTESQRKNQSAQAFVIRPSSSPSPIRASACRHDGHHRARRSAKSGADVRLFSTPDRPPQSQQASDDSSSLSPPPPTPPLLVKGMKVGPPIPYSRLTVGVLKETYPGENRVSLAPSNVRTLLDAGLKVVVESGGECRFLSQSDATRLTKYTILPI